MHALKLLTAALALCLTQGQAHAAAELAGTWKFEKWGEYYGTVKTVIGPEVELIQIVNSRMMHPKCNASVDFEKTELDYSELFQDNTKADISPSALDKYLRKTFAFSLSTTRHYYRASEETFPCNDSFRDLLVSKDRIVDAQGGTIFFRFTRVVTSLPANAAALGLDGRKLTQLPYHSNTFFTLCRKRMPLYRGEVATTDACAPVFHPYVASKKDTDPLAKLIGAHNYSKRGAVGTKNYNNPVARNLNPVYFVLPPLKNVVVVAVEDMQQGEDFGRDGINGVYLAIVDGVVTDQLSVGCVLNEQYFCVDNIGKKLYELLDIGKFKKLN